MLSVLILNQSFAQTDVYVYASTSGWTNSGITKAANEVVRICASGQVQLWTDDLYCNQTTPSGQGRVTNGCGVSCGIGSNGCATCPVGSLIGRIGTGGTPFFVGDRAYLTGSDAGLLYFKVNDTDLTGNDGHFIVTVVDGTNEATVCAAIESCYSSQIFTESRVVAPSPIVKEVEGPKNLGKKARVYPNPAKNLIHIDLKVEEKTADVQVALYTLDGALLENLQEGTLEEGTHHFTYDIPKDTPLTMILVQTTINGKRDTEKVSVVKE